MHRCWKMLQWKEIRNKGNYCILAMSCENKTAARKNKLNKAHYLGLIAWDDAQRMTWLDISQHGHVYQ